MPQPSTFSKIARFTLGGLALAGLSFCQNSPNGNLVGQWSNGLGQTLIFEPGGAAKQLVRFGSLTDTFLFQYKYDCRPEPAQLDFFGFKNGPLSGKTLLGILEWTSDSAFRFQAESELRPQEFNSEAAEVFRRN